MPVESVLTRMYEVEVKVPADLEATRRRLADLDADALERVRQVDTYYDAPHRSFEETDEALRVRAESVVDESGGTRPRLTYKGPLVDDESKTREEVETDVADERAIETILTRLGFEPAATVSKERERFSVDGYVVALDSVHEVGDYVEVEIETTEADLERARDGALALIERLGLDPDEQVRRSYLALSADGDGRK